MKVTSKLVGNTPTQEIDWNKPQLVVYNEGRGGEYVVLTTGFHECVNFAGVVVYSKNDEIFIGEYAINYNKKFFSIVPSNQQVILQNTPDEL